MMTPDQSCKKCIYWSEIVGTEVGKCRRYPPQMLAIQDTSNTQSLDLKTGMLLGQRPQSHVVIRGEFPVLSKDDIGCGEFKHKDHREPGL